jgi:geranylgeranyl transferase type-1 subunit beta
VSNRDGLLKFLAGRQFAYDAEEEAEEDDDDEGPSENFIETELGALHLDDGFRHVGFNGRWNKKADTCYYWWAAGALAVSQDGHISRNSLILVDY